MNRAEEDYIKMIYELTVEKDLFMIKTNELSDRFGFTDQSVNEMIKKLETKNLVSFIPYKGVSLTPKGKTIAIRMIRAHRIWEVFLTQKLGFSWESVHEDAEMLEHATSTEVLEALYKYLGKPKYCQHGNPIPNLKGKMEKSATLSLDEVEVGKTFEITRVLDLKELLIFLNENEIRLHDQYEIMDKDSFNGVIKIKNQKGTKIISIKTAKMLFGHQISA
ncbi:MAG: metal-dependent transcriptional regulator [Acholeplasmataceae bacterium]|nr:metal-dependent transcriptional regulator [Acholeplasmataceae bacterium]